jgi:hypothetical protein
MKRLRLILLASVLGVMSLARAEDRKNSVTCEVGEKYVDFRDGKELVARYHIGPEVAKPFFYPLAAPGGIKVTRGVPVPKGETDDHPHQKSAWFCHGDVIPDGIELKQKIKGVKGVDFWSEAAGHGKMVCTKVSPEEGKGEAVLATLNEWRTADDVKILDESRRIRLRPVEGGYLFVFDIELKASVCPLTFGDTKEGSFGVRVPDSMTEKKGKGTLTNAEGKTGMPAIWGKRSKWSDYSGPVADKDGETKTAGVTIFDDPKNTVPACWHSRDYGLMAANPFGRTAFPGAKEDKLFHLSKGETLKLRYGLFVHKGDVKEGKVAEAYGQFVGLK